MKHKLITSGLILTLLLTSVTFEIKADKKQENICEFCLEKNQDNSNYCTSKFCDNYETKGQIIVDYALQFVGNPYVYGGTSLTNGADCSGFVQTVFKDNDITLERTAGAQSQGGDSIELENIEPGDLLFYGGSGDYGIGHVAIYAGDGQIVHASSSRTGIIISDYDYNTPVSAKRYWE